MAQQNRLKTGASVNKYEWNKKKEEEEEERSILFHHRVACSSQIKGPGVSVWEGAALRLFRWPISESYVICGAQSLSRALQTASTGSLSSASNMHVGTKSYQVQ